MKRCQGAATLESGKRKSWQGYCRLQTLVTPRKSINKPLTHTHIHTHSLPLSACPSLKAETDTHKTM